jgi:hypothetical protein
MRYSALTLDSKYKRNVLAFLSNKYYSTVYRKAKSRNLGKSDSGITIKFIPADITLTVAEIPETHPLFNAAWYYYLFYKLKKVNERAVITEPITDILKLENWTIE